MNGNPIRNRKTVSQSRSGVKIGHLLSRNYPGDRRRRNPFPYPLPQRPRKDLGWVQSIPVLWGRLRPPEGGTPTLRIASVFGEFVGVPDLSGRLFDLVRPPEGGTPTLRIASVFGESVGVPALAGPNTLSSYRLRCLLLA